MTFTLSQNHGRSTEEWGPDDYDICNGSLVVGRLRRDEGMDPPWFWALSWGSFNPKEEKGNGRAATREDALVQFEACYKKPRRWGSYYDNYGDLEKDKT